MENTKHSLQFDGVTRDAFYFLAALAGILIVCISLPFDLHVNPSYFFLMHTLLESCGIIIAAMIFIVGWAPLENRRTLRSTILASAFLSIGIMELAHMVTFDGTFAESIAYSRASSIKLTLAAQAFASIGLLNFAFSPARTINKQTANIFYIAFALCSVALVGFIFATTDATSSILDSEMGLSPFKIGFEVCVGALFTIAGFKIFPRGKQAKSYSTLNIATAAFVLAMSVVFFSNYFHVNDLMSLLGHVYKLAAYILLYRALALKNIKGPYYEIRDLKQRIESTLDALPDLVFECSLDGDIYEYHSSQGVNGLVASPEVFLGHNFREFLPVDAANTIAAALQEANEQGANYGKQYSLSMPDGEHHYEISASALINAEYGKHFMLIVRDVTERHALAQRLEALLSLSEKSAKLNQKAAAQLGLDMLEKLTNSKVSFLHFLSEDEREIELFAWGSETEAYYCKAEQELHYPIESAGIWADCVRTRKTIIVNDYANEATKKGLPDGHSILTRFMSAPIFQGERIAMIVGIGNADYAYTDSTVTTTTLFGNELYQILQRRRSENESEKNRKLLTSAFDNLPIGIAISNRDDGKFEYFNNQLVALFGLSSNHPTNVVSLLETAIGEKEIRLKMLENIASDEHKQSTWKRIPVKHDGEVQRYISVQIVRVENTNLDIILVEDMTDDIRNEEATRIAATAFSSQEGILITDADLCILRANESFSRDSGFNAEELIGKPLAFFQPELKEPQLYKEVLHKIEKTGTWRGEVSSVTKGGNLLPSSLTISSVKNEWGKITHFVADYIDLSDLKSAQDVISRLSYFDTLTGVPNREQLKSVLTELTLSTPVSGEHIAAMMIDVDDFKKINETLGHESGDLLLLEIAQRLKNISRSGDHVARYGGDEFVMLAIKLGNDSEQASLKAQLIAQSIINSLEDSYTLGGKSYFTTVSIGTTLFKAGNLNTYEVFKQLDIALASAKSVGKNQIRFFDPIWQESINRQAQLLDELRLAIREHQLELYYQAQLNDQSQIVAAEGLIRWNHPTRGLLLPSEFLPTAFQNNLMIKLGDEVLRLGIRQLNTWQKDSEFRGIKLSLNITSDQFYEEYFEKNLLTLLGRFEIIPGSLMLEFTESMILGSVEAAREKIMRLNEADVTFAIDDFGTGYSSLSYLSTLPVDQLKIDQSFVRNIGVVETDAKIVEAIINMAHILKLNVIAEGVETQAQLNYLITQSCEMFQGYLFSKPLPIEQFNALYLSPTTPKEQA